MNDLFWSLGLWDRLVSVETRVSYHHTQGRTVLKACLGLLVFVKSTQFFFFYCTFIQNSANKLFLMGHCKNVAVSASGPV